MQTIKVPDFADLEMRVLAHCKRELPMQSIATVFQCQITERILLQEACEFEARVAAHLAEWGEEDVPCAHGMRLFCPHPPFEGDGCGPWCRLKEARLAVEEEMEKEGRWIQR